MPSRRVSNLDFGFARARLMQALVVLSLLFAQAVALPTKAFGVPAEPELAEAKAAIVCDSAGNVLWSKDPEGGYAPASITKVMTAMIALDSDVPLDALCDIVAPDVGGNSQTAGYVAGDRPSFAELLQSMLVYSGNDAAANVAWTVAGSEEAFVGLMNERATALGFTHTQFRNAHGMDTEGHYSCVQDLVAMGRVALVHYPFIAETVRLEGVDAHVGGGVEHLYSTDDLMGNYDGLLGIKTGAVETGTAFLGASRRGNVTLYTCVLGCETGEGRFSDTVALMDWAYATYRQRSMTPEEWPIRVGTDALSFSRRHVVRATSGIQATVWPTGTLSYRAVLGDPYVLLEDGDAAGAIWWRQSGRSAGAGTLEADTGTTSVPAVNAFELDLFS